MKAEQYKYLICDAKCDNVNIIVNFQVQNKKNEWSSLYEDQLPVIPSQDSTTDPPEIHGQICNINYASVHERDIEQADDSTLFIQNYSLLKYIQDPENLISINTCAQGSIRFTLPSGRTVLRFALATRYISNMDVMVEKRDSDSIQFGTLDQIVPFASKFPFSWEIYGKELLVAVKAIVDGLGQHNNVKERRHISVLNLYQLTVFTYNRMQFIIWPLSCKLLIGKTCGMLSAMHFIVWLQIN